MGIDRIGCQYRGQVERGGIIYRLESSPALPTDFPYIIVSNSADSANLVDLVTVSSYSSAKNALKKKAHKGLGIEFLIGGARLKKGHEIARWLNSLAEAYRFCKSSHCQFILSSGAKTPQELISGICMDAILAEIGIEPHHYWKELEAWVKVVTSRQVVLQ